MSSQVKCDTCKGHRWLAYAPRWNAGTIAGSWRPFGRDVWDETTSLLRAVALATKVLVPCECNGDRLMPWAKEWERRAAPAAGANGKAPAGAGGDPY